MAGLLRTALRAPLSIALDPWAWIIGVGWLVMRLVGITAVLLSLHLAGLL